MTNSTTPYFLEDTDESEISSDVAGIGNLLVTTHIPIRADGTMETGDITAQSECTLNSLRTSLEKAGSSLANVIHLTIYLTDINERPAFNEVLPALLQETFSGSLRCRRGGAGHAGDAGRSHGYGGTQSVAADTRRYSPYRGRGT